jgi:putative phosphoribosyl transferase
MFSNRIEAGIQLAAKLTKFKNQSGVLLAVPRGGVPVAYAIAKELKLPVELLLTKKIGHPMNKEYAIGAASINDYFIANPEDISEEYIKNELYRIRTRLKEMKEKFKKDKEPTNLQDKIVIIIDDGIATGNTLLGTIHLLRKNKPNKIVIAVPVASKKGFNKLLKEVDEIVMIQIPEIFHGVGEFYENFEQVSDKEVINYLQKIDELVKEKI